MLLLLKFWGAVSRIAVRDNFFSGIIWLEFFCNFFALLLIFRIISRFHFYRKLSTPNLFFLKAFQRRLRQLLYLLKPKILQNSLFLLRFRIIPRSIQSSRFPKINLSSSSRSMYIRIIIIKVFCHCGIKSIVFFMMRSRLLFNY